MRSDISNLSSPTLGAGLRVLIVEDEPVARRALAALLRAGGFEPIVAASAEEALCLLGQMPAPAIALVDLDLPGMNGLELIHRLRRSNPGLAPLLQTASDSDRLARYLRAVPVPFLRKPLDHARLLRLLAEAASCSASHLSH